MRHSRLFRTVAAGVLLGLGGIAAAGQAPAPTPAGGKRAMTFADMMAMKQVSDPQISPSGKWVLFSVTDVSLERNTKTNHLWVVPIDGNAPERQLTPGAGESFGRFAPNGTLVSYTQAPGKDKAAAGIVVAAWDEKTGTIGAAKALSGLAADADGAIWSPDSKRFLFTTGVYPECSVKGGGAAKTDTEILYTLHHPSEQRPLAGDPGQGAAQNDAAVEISGTNNVAAWRTMQPAAWAEEDACDKAKDGAADKNPVKAQVWDGLMYRHWVAYTGAKRTHILVMDADGGNVRDLTTARDVGDAQPPVWLGPLVYAWAPDSKEIAYVTNLDAVPAASTNNDVFTLRLDEGGSGNAAKPVKVSTSAGSDDEPEYSPDGKYLAFRSQRQAGFESDRERLMLSERVSKGERVSESASQQVSGPEWSEPKELMPSPFDRWVDEFTWLQDSRHLLFAEGNEGEEPYGIVSTEEHSPGYYEHRTRFDERGEFSDLRIFGDTVVATRMLVNSPSEIVSIPPQQYDANGNPVGKQSLIALTHLNDTLLSQLDLDPLEPFWFTGAEGTKVEGFILKPPGFDAKKKYPVKFLMHGGPQTAWGDAWSDRWNWELMAASGYVVVGINRRGSTGYGQKFVDEVSGDWGGRAYEDLMKGLDYAEANYPFIDKTRECALGASYGGYMADWVLTHTNRFQCIVTHDGMYDPVSAYGTTEEMWFPEWEFRRPEDYPKGWDGFTGGYDPVGHRNPTHDDKAVVNGPPEDGGGHAAEPWRYAGLPASEDPFRRWSPMQFIQNAKTPTLVIHSQKDYRLDISQDFELFTALQRLGVPSRFLYFPDEGHWVLKPRNAELWNAVVEEWCDRWTRSAGNRPGSKAP